MHIRWWQNSIQEIMLYIDWLNKYSPTVWSWWWGSGLHFSGRWSADAFPRHTVAFLTANVNWTEELATEQFRFKPGWLFDLRLSSATGLSWTETWRWTFERIDSFLLCWDNSTIDQCTPRVDAVIKVRGGHIGLTHIEYLFDWGSIHSRC